MQRSKKSLRSLSYRNISRVIRQIAFNANFRTVYNMPLVPRSLFSRLSSDGDDLASMPDSRSLFFLL